MVEINVVVLASDWLWLGNVPDWQAVIGRGRQREREREREGNMEGVEIECVYNWVFACVFGCTTMYIGC